MSPWARGRLVALAACLLPVLVSAAEPLAGPPDAGTATPSLATPNLDTLAELSRSTAPSKAGRAVIASPSHLLLAPAATPAPGQPTPTPVTTVRALQARGHKVIPWTVNAPERMEQLLAEGVDGLITDAPDLLREVLEKVDAQKTRWLLPDGRVDPARFSFQGHRGARDLRPENTLPSMEAALDVRVNTLETDILLTQDGVPVLCHEPSLLPEKFRRADGKPLEAPVLIRTLGFRALQTDYVGDRLLPDRPRQQNALELSPVSVAFAKARGLPHPYVAPSVTQLFDFVRFYARYHRTGAGRTHPDAARRARNAEQVRFNLELKLTPETEAAGQVPPVATVTDALTAVLVAEKLTGRVNVQSFDARPMRRVHERLPALPTAYLFKAP